MAKLLRSRTVRIVGLVLVGLFAFGSYEAYRRIAPALGWVDPVVDTVPPELPAAIASAPVAILSFSKTSGFRHGEAIEAAAASVRDLAQERGWAVFETENAAVFNPEQLALFDVVFGNNITGDNWTEQQKAAFRSWIEDGGGFVGVHGAAGTRFRYWDWYTDVLLGGGRFIGHPMGPQFREATLVVEDPDHPIMAGMERTFSHVDEWYSFEESARSAGSHVLVTIDEASYAPGEDLSMGEDHPIVWIACPGRGRSFYSALGHQGSTYTWAAHERMLGAALDWATGDACP
jgi:type 1 glutamine amidotransferase